MARTRLFISLEKMPNEENLLNCIKEASYKTFKKNA